MEWNLILEYPDGREEEVTWEYENEDPNIKGTSDDDYYRDQTFQHWAEEAGAQEFRYAD